MQSEPIHDVAHLAHVEMLTPKPDESLHTYGTLPVEHVEEKPAKKAGGS